MAILQQGPSTGGSCSFYGFLGLWSLALAQGDEIYASQHVGLLSELLEVSDGVGSRGEDENQG